MLDVATGGEHSAQLLDLIAASPSPYHAAANAAAMLDGVGFEAFDEQGPFGRSDPQTSDLGYVLRGGSLVAWARPAAAPPERCMRIVGAHTDSPNLRLKPAPDTGAPGWRQIAVEPYGGVLLTSWLGRDLGISGRVSVAGDPTAEVHLVRIDEPLFHLAQLAIHLDRDVNRDGLKVDPQRHLRPIWSTDPPRQGAVADLLAGELDVPADRILAWELMLHDTEPGRVVGDGRQMISASRLDNLVSCHSALRALLSSVGGASDGDRPVAVVALFDHEEVGSVSAEGAAGPLLEHVVERVVGRAGGGREDLLRSLAGSVCISADGAHATHPDHLERHEPSHRVLLNAGPALKSEVNARYATSAPVAGWFEQVCADAGVPLQRFVNRADMPCGSTIGPIAAARLGVPTLDVGAPQLAMHSARELCGTKDPAWLTAALSAALVTI